MAFEVKDESYNVRKLAHIRSIGHGLRTWDAPVYVIPLPSPSISFYDGPEDIGDTQVSRWSPSPIPGGSTFSTPPMQSRAPRIAMQFDSARGAARWQSLFVTRWEHLIPSRPMISQTRQLNMNANRNQRGSKEQQRATVYNPWPSNAALEPKAL
jgi:hypothetical protein